MLTTGLFEIRAARLIAAAVTTLAALAVSLLLAPGVAHAYEVNLSIKGAGKITEVTDAGQVDRACGTGGLQSPNTTPTGTIGAYCSPGSPDGGYGYGWIVEYRAEAKEGFTFVGWQNGRHSTQPEYSPVLCDGSNNQSTYSGTNCRFQIFQNLQTQAVFADTTAPPVPSITAGPNRPVKDFANFTFELPSSDPTFKQFECRVVNVTTLQACNSSFSVDVRGSSYTDSSYTLEVRARDYSDNVSYSSSSSFTVDKTAPNTILDPSVGPAEGSTVESGNVTFAFSSSEPTNATFECSLDGAAFSSCNPLNNTSTTKSYTNLKDGPHSFRVRAIDRAGNVDTTYTNSTRNWTVRNAPTVVESSLSPPRNQPGVTRITNVSATFSEEMDANSLRDVFTNTSTTFKLQMYNKKTKKWKTIPATIALTNTNRTATLDPFGATEGAGDTPLAANKKFRGLITTGAKDLAGNPLAKSFVWIFYTGSS